MILVSISSLDYNVRIRLVNSRILRCSLRMLWLELLSRHHLVMALTARHSILREILTRRHSSRLTWLWLHIVICWLYINPLVIDHVTTVMIQSYQSWLVILSLLPVLELHLDESEASTLACRWVSHYDGVCNMTMLFEILNKVWFLSLECKTTNKKLYLVIRSLLVKLCSVGRTTRNESLWSKSRIESCLWIA